jgi:chromosome partitioning protein
MIILIGAEKGGTGKTTLAISLAAMRAAQGKDVLLLDTDIQGSATYWSHVRDEASIEPFISCVQKFGDVDKEVNRLAKKFDDIIIDAGGRDSKELRTSMLVADIVYIPLQPSQFDIWTIMPMAEMVDKALSLNPKLSARIILNRASANPAVTEAEEAQEMLADFEQLSLSQVVIRERIAFRKAAREGRCVVESKNPDAKAIKEIQQFYKEIYND